MGPEDKWQKSISGRRNSICRGPEVEVDLPWLKKSKEVSV
jgi:hypothetical protein